MASAEAEAAEAAFAEEAALLQQALGAEVVHADVGVHAIELVLLESPMERGGDGLAHESPAPVGGCEVEGDLGPAVREGYVVETAGADELIVVAKCDGPARRLAGGPTGGGPLDHGVDELGRDLGIAGELGDDGLAQVGVERSGVGRA